MFCLHRGGTNDITKVWSNFYFAQHNTTRSLNISKPNPNFFIWQVQYRPGSRIASGDNTEILSPHISSLSVQPSIIKDNEVFPWQEDYKNNRDILDNNMPS